MTYGVIFVGGVILVVECIVVTKGKADWTPNDILRLFGLTVIAVLSVMLLSAGYTSSQIAPVVGLFGTTLGYILGSAKPRR